VAAGGRFDWGAAVTDLVTTAVITAVVLYLGVFKEPGASDEMAGVLSELQDSMNAAVRAAVARFADGRHTDVDVKLIAEHLPAHQAAKFRRATAKATAGRMWKASQIRANLGLANDARAIRDLNRKINTLAKNPDHGLERDVDGRTWLIPHALVMELWGEDMAAFAVTGAAMDRALIGGSSRRIAAPDPVTPVTRRAMSGPEQTLSTVDALIADLTAQAERMAETPETTETPQLDAIGA
jgi:hypothetical protein